MLNLSKKKKDIVLIECTYLSMQGDFQEPFVAQPAWIFLSKANVQGAHESYKSVLLFAEALAYQVD